MEELDIATIKQRSIHGVFAVLSRQLAATIISFGTSLIIYTQLAASDVGIYTAVVALQRVVSFFTDLGLGAALVQKKEALTQEDLATSFTIQAAITGSIFLIIFLLRDTIATFFRLNASGERLLIVLVFTIFLSSFKIIPSILLEREIQFGKLAIPQIVESITFNILLVIFVLLGKKIDSYSIAFLVSGLVSIPVYYILSPWRISVGFHREAFHHLKYGTRFQIKNILATIKDDLLTVILVKFLSFRDIGYVGFAQRNAFFPFRFIVDSVTKVSFSTYSRLQETKEYLKTTIEKSLFLVSSSLFPILTGLIVTAPYIILYFPKWHNKWEPAILSLIFFSLNAAVSSLSNILVTVLDANGRVKTTLNLMVIWTIMTWTLTPLLIKMIGFNGVALASFLVTTTVGITVYYVRRIVTFSFFGSIYKPLLSAVVMGVIVFAAERLFVYNFVSLILVAIAGAGIYGACLYIFAPAMIKDAVQLLKQRK